MSFLRSNTLLLFNSDVILLYFLLYALFWTHVSVLISIMITWKSVASVRVFGTRVVFKKILKCSQLRIWSMTFLFWNVYICWLHRQLLFWKPAFISFCGQFAICDSQILHISTQSISNISISMLFSLSLVFQVVDFFRIQKRSAKWRLKKLRRPFLFAHYGNEDIKSGL